MKSIGYHRDGETGLRRIIGIHFCDVWYSKCKTLSRASLRYKVLSCVYNQKQCCTAPWETSKDYLSSQATDVHLELVHKLFSISPTYEWINTDKRCLNVGPELCFDSCHLNCLPLCLSFNYIRLTQCFICHPWLIAERDKISHGMKRFSFSHCQDAVLAAFLLNHSLPTVSYHG